MPVQYEGVLAEHASVRDAVGVFDVSHLGRFEVAGRGSTELLRTQLCNDIARIGTGRAQYTMALNDLGGVEDDIIVWWLNDERFWVMPNGTNFDDIVKRFSDAAPDGVEISDVRAATVLLAVQGPDAPRIIDSALGAKPGRFRVMMSDFEGFEVVAAGTGYTGEPGGELCVPIDGAEALWNTLVQAGATPCGLGARDTLRLEMGYPLWGQDLDPDTTPLEAGLSWVVAWDHDFVGRAALLAKRDHREKELVAFATEGRTIPRHGYTVRAGESTGTVTSGNFSPTLQHGIGLAYLSPPPDADAALSVTIRGRDVTAARESVPFLEK
ncbi:MAG: glycine cleavage system aminomethyltransferase GcvT [Acidimicrobiia bacterium]|nr:MAG: glycine cleavage system aminomethyltransferase GcvT [Acidimicrobiia bacterium]